MQRQVGQPPPHKRTKIRHQQQRRAEEQQKQQHRQQQQQQQQQQQPQFHRLLEISQINLLSREVQNWIHEQCALSDNIEIEAKLGKLLTWDPTNACIGNDDDMNHMNGDENKTKEIRVHDKIGLKSLAWIDLHKTGGHFESTVSEQVFIHLNKMFNAWYTNCNSNQAQILPILKKVSFPKLLYKRSRTIDKIYHLNPGDKSSSIRVVIDMENPNIIKECMEKKKKSSMNISYPASKYDIRISASIENIVPKPSKQIVSSLRCKDRISYKYDYFSIDITSTHTYSKGLTQQFINNIIHKFKNKSELPLSLQYGTLRTYEVELEIADQKYLSRIRKVAAEKREFYQIQQLSYFFTQAAIQLSELASNLNFIPSVCKLPSQKK